MSIPQNVADILRGHVTLEIEGIDRMSVQSRKAAPSHDRVFPQAPKARPIQEIIE
ncbi:MAG: hypothetical protein ACREXU_21090 [Gammaproteobacteria bacterium]